MPDLTLLTGAGIFLAGMAAGRFWPSRRRKSAPGAPKPLCACQHERAYHDANGKCHSLQYVPGTGSRSSHHVDCRCRQYSGPEPLPEFYAPEIAP